MTFTLNLSNNQIEILVSKYNEYNIPYNNNYTLFRAKIKSTTLTIYKTGKVLLQGNDCSSLYKEICLLLSIDFVLDEQKDFKENKVIIGKSILGTDEVGTGDYFGGIVVCACYVPNDKILELTKKGIKDSKLLSDDKIISLAKELIDKIDHSVLLLNNIKYNQIINDENMNLNKIKAILHNKVIINFINKYPEIQPDDIVIDGFCDENKYKEYIKNIKTTMNNVKLIEKAESKYISVAAASIIARYYFLKHLDDLSLKSGYTLLKGASSKVDLLAKKIINEKGIDFLYNIAKMNFKNTAKAKGERNETI